MRLHKKITPLLAQVVTFFSLSLFSSSVALAQDSTSEAEFVKSQLEKLVGPDAIGSIAETKYPGVYLFTNSAGGITFVHAAGDLIMVGDGYDINEKRDVLNDLRDEKMVDAVNSLSDDAFIEIGPKDAKRYINVFTDIDCGYCRKLHFEIISQLSEKGIKTRYIMWPRSGLNTKSHEKAVTAFCSDDREKAMDKLKSGEDLPKIECDNPIAELFELGQKAGVNGTPTIVTDNGVVIGGYVPVGNLLAAMNFSE